MSLKLLELLRGDQIMIATYRNTSLSSPSSWSELDTQVSVSTLYILMRTIDTEVLVLLISYIGKVELNDIEIHVYIINSDRYYNIKQIIRELGSDIFLALLFFYAFTGCDSFLQFLR